MSAHSRRQYVQGETVIDAAPVAVWEVLSDFHGVDTWAPIITRVVDIGPTARGVGTARHCHLRRLGGIDEVVAVWEEGRRLSYRVSPLGPIGGSQSSWEIEPLAEQSTRVKLRLDYDLRFGPLGALLHALVVRRLLVRNLPSALAALKRRVETGRTVGSRRRGPVRAPDRGSSARRDGGERHMMAALTWPYTDDRRES